MSIEPKVIKIFSLTVEVILLRRIQRTTRLRALWISILLLLQPNAYGAELDMDDYYDCLREEWQICLRLNEKVKGLCKTASGTFCEEKARGLHPFFSNPFDEYISLSECNLRELQKCGNDRTCRMMGFNFCDREYADKNYRR